jgi:type II secretory pathway pseudopilin PulG
MRSKGQVWVETVVYTLVGLSLIGLVLAFVIPKVNEYRDRSVIENTISALNVIDGKINEVLEAPLNTRVVDMTLKRGDLYFDALNDSVYFILENSKVAYSEVNEPVSIGRITAYTEKKSDEVYRVRLVIDYAFNLDYEGNESVRKYSPASVPYRFSFTNQGSADEGSLPTIGFRELSE